MVVGGPCSFEGCKRTTMYQSHYCYKHKDESSREETEHIPILEPITLMEDLPQQLDPEYVYGGYLAKEQVPPELLKFAEHLSSAGKTVYDVFSGMDLNEDGTLDESEVQKGLALLEKNLWWTEAGEIDALTPSDIDSLVNAFDRSGDGKIDLTEFDALLRIIPGYDVESENNGPRGKGTLLAVALNLIWLIVLGDAAGDLVIVSLNGGRIFGFVGCLALIWPALAVFAYVAHRQRGKYRLGRIESA